MSKIYILAASYGENCCFIEDYPEGEESIMGISMEWKWLPVTNYKPICLELLKSETGKRNYKFDFSDMLNPFLVFSKNAINVLKPILDVRGQYLEVITDSKRKKYIGYYPTNPLKGVLDLEKSVYKRFPKGLLIRKPVLYKEKISDEYLFTLEEDISRIFVTEKFKNLVEENGLVGFKFSEYNEVELS